MCCGNFNRQEAIPTINDGACFCGCHGPMQSAPRFVSKDRRIAKLEQHLEDLKVETKAVEEHIAQIKKQK